MLNDYFKGFVITFSMLGAPETSVSDISIGSWVALIHRKVQEKFSS